ncbi:MAG: NAD(+)/NADH kinase [Oscillospiraceae bacterium]|jgi:NAD+ kinase|nr:NAD(+)/NADH kinase [Oscillospiraceae bacterium]
MKIAILLNLKNSQVKVYTEKIIKKLKSLNAQILMLSSYKNIFYNKNIIFCENIDELMACCEIALTIGGDGTLIHVAKYAAHSGKPILGINLGRVGFAASLEKDEIDKLSLLVEGNYVIEKRAMLSVEVQDKKSQKSFLALNDAVISRCGISKITDFFVFYEGKTFEYRADGLIFATPTGSTAYSLSAGGPVIDPSMRCILFTQICPYSLFSRSIIFSKSVQLEVKTRIESKNAPFQNENGNKESADNADEANISLTIDGEIYHKLTKQQIVKIKLSKMKANLICLCERNFCDTLEKKMIRKI